MIQTITLQVKSKIANKLNNKFNKNMGWMIGAEGLNRVFRLLSTVFLARLLTKEDYGLAAIVLTLHEFISVFGGRSGIGSKLIQCTEEEFNRLAPSAYWLTWFASILLFVLQCGLSYPIALFYKNPSLVWPICAVSLTYLITPLFAIQSATITRSNNLSTIAISSTIKAFVSNLFTIGLALLGFGMWAIVLPSVFSSLTGALYIRSHSHWRNKTPYTITGAHELLSFGLGTLGIEMLGKLRGNLDYLIVGGTLGVRALGIYYFAFNAGLGVSLSIINAFSSTFYPYLCEVRTDKRQLRKRYYQGVRTIIKTVGIISVIQSVLAYWYVPIIFGEKWNEAVPILILICLSAIPRPLGYATGALFNSQGNIHYSVIYNTIYTFIFGCALMVGVKWGPIGVAIAVLVCIYVGTPSFTMWATKKTFNTRRIV